MYFWFISHSSEEAACDESEEPSLSKSITEYACASAPVITDFILSISVIILPKKLSLKSPLTLSTNLSKKPPILSPRVVKKPFILSGKSLILFITLVNHVLSLVGNEVKKFIEEIGY